MDEAQRWEGPFLVELVVCQEGDGKDSGPGNGSSGLRTMISSIIGTHPQMVASRTRVSRSVDHFLDRDPAYTNVHVARTIQMITFVGRKTEAVAARTSASSSLYQCQISLSYGIRIDLDLRDAARLGP